MFAGPAKNFPINIADKNFAFEEKLWTMIITQYIDISIPLAKYTASGFNSANFLFPLSQLIILTNFTFIYY